ncbi:MAG: hypothetical protein EOO46_20285 [Flavobacterium sp.]|nr:MAG: hypothetical protein EOO46_20285 [Flavobacterium sp.]
MKKIILLLFIITFCRCEQKFELPKNSKVIAKYIVFDENISPYLDVCKDKDDTIADFKTRGLDCMFRLDKDIFEIEYVITLSEKGRIKNIGTGTTNRVLA